MLETDTLWSICHIDLKAHAVGCDAAVARHGADDKRAQKGAAHVIGFQVLSVPDSDEDPWRRHDGHVNHVAHGRGGHTRLHAR